MQTCHGEGGSVARRIRFRDSRTQTKRVQPDTMPPKSSKKVAKKRAAAAPAAPVANKQPRSQPASAEQKKRSEVHKLQRKLAKCCAKAILNDEEPVIIKSNTGTGKPRILGELLDLLDASQPAGLTIYVSLTTIKAKEEWADIGSLFHVHYGAAHNNTLISKVKDKGESVRIMIPIATFRKMAYGKGGKVSLEGLLEMLGKPFVRICFDEVHEVYKKPNDKMPSAINNLRDGYPDGKLAVIGMSATPELEECWRKASILFGEYPVEYELDEEDGVALEDHINVQRKVCERKMAPVIELPMPPADI